MMRQQETMMPLKELETESAGMQTTTLTQLFVSLPRLGGGWCANKSLQPTPGDAVVCNSPFSPGVAELRR
jgi:hypothetical protein